MKLVDLFIFLIYFLLYLICSKSKPTRDHTRMHNGIRPEEDFSRYVQFQEKPCDQYEFVVYLEHLGLGEPLWHLIHSSEEMRVM